MSDDQLYTYQEGTGELSLRVYMLMAHDIFPALRAAGLKTGFGDDRLRMGGIKMVSDGAIATRTAYLSVKMNKRPFIFFNNRKETMELFL